MLVPKVSTKLLDDVVVSLSLDIDISSAKDRRHYAIRFIFTCACAPPFLNRIFVKADEKIVFFLTHHLIFALFYLKMVKRRKRVKYASEQSSSNTKRFKAMHQDNVESPFPTDSKRHKKFKFSNI